MTAVDRVFTLKRQSRPLIRALSGSFVALAAGTSLAVRGTGARRVVESTGRTRDRDRLRRESSVVGAGWCSSARLLLAKVCQ